MGATWNSWKTLKIIFTILQISALSIGKTTDVTGVEGQSLDFRCEYPLNWGHNAKYFCRIDDSLSCNNLIKTVKHNQWVQQGRFSLYDNTTGGVFIINVDRLSPEDSGNYLCGVDIAYYLDTISEIRLNVSPAPTTAVLPENLMHNKTITAIPPEDLTLHKSHLPLVLTAVMCVAALLFVCTFSVSLLLRQQNSGTQHNREISSDYETMNPVGSTRPELNCSPLPPTCPDVEASPPPPELYHHINSYHRESTVTLGLDDYANVDVAGQICQYHHLDPNLIEEHIYHCLRPTTNLDDGSMGVKGFTTNKSTS